MPMQMLAAIDVGSSEVSMKIYQFSKRTGIQELEYIRSMVEMGADTYNTGVISLSLIHISVRISAGKFLTMPAIRRKRQKKSAGRF